MYIMTKRAGTVWGVGRKASLELPRNFCFLVFIYMSIYVCIYAYKHQNMYINVYIYLHTYDKAGGDRFGSP